MTYTQFREPSRHSWRSPASRMERNDMSAIMGVKEESLVTSRIGRRSATSTSKMRNTTARRKKRRENGSRAEFFGSKPHSNGVVVFRWEGVRIAVVNITVASTVAIVIAVAMSRANFTILCDDESNDVRRLYVMKRKIEVSLHVIVK